MTKLKQRIEELEAELAVLKAECAKAEQDELWPKYGEYYWTVTNKGHITELLWDAEAVAYREWQTDPRVVARGMIERMEGFDPLTTGAMIRWSYQRNKMYISQPVQITSYIGGLAFTSVAYAQAAINKLGEPLIKVALGVITGEEAKRIVREA